ncbi:uncharacterized protein LOC116351211 [Contarinia nasturtii]|uniref:uncharacterized protein LOC116351211 n=1 Tax=Contarinia nasturtii TaxID=265458 RepID=UPI0012D4099B|nr:uncharacterized protein LOC116351211 [Contarinia nasturtii]
MISKILIIAVLCVSYTLAEAPVNRYRSQRFRQAPPRQYSRQFSQRQESPYPQSQGNEPAAEYGAPKPTYGPPSTNPPPVYGAPAAGDVEPVENSDSEVVGQPSRLTQFNEKLSLPSNRDPQKFSQKLELQQQVQQFPSQQIVTPFVAAAPIQPVVGAPVQFAQAIQPEGSYYIQLPSGSIQRVNYLTQPSVVDNSVLAKLQFRPVGGLQTTVVEPQQLYVNTVVQSHVSSDE